MGSNQFQKEYIEYLQERNTELLNRLNQMKENYENKILLTDINKNYLMSALEEVLNICTVIPHEIDLFFDKITAAMGTFKNILLRKSEMVQLVEKISKALNSFENFSPNSVAMDSSGLSKNISEGRTNRKVGIVRVSPMVNGHIISTEPRIFLSRVPGIPSIFTPGRRNVLESQLSPIIEESPEFSSEPSNLGSQVFREIKIPLERLNLNKISYNYISEESPKSRFKGPKTWKKSLSSTKQQLDTQRNTPFYEDSENINKNLSIGEREILHQRENNDPLEGPSWLYEDNSEFDLPCSRFMEYKRRKHRFATIFDNDEDGHTYLKDNYKKSLKKYSNQCYEDPKKTDNDDEDFDEDREKISEASEDLIGKSFSSDCDENYSSFKRRRKGSKRKCSKESDFEDELDKDSNKETSTPYTKKKKNTSGTPVFVKSFEADINEKKSAQKLRKEKKSKKLHLESPKERMSAELSFSKMSRKSDHLAPEVRISKTNADTKMRNSLKKSLKSESFIESVDYTTAEENLLKKLRTSEINKSQKRISKSKSRSPAVSLQENEGRKKRKAAPSFKLVEPRLKTKLRRN